MRWKHRILWYWNIVCLIGAMAKIRVHVAPENSTVPSLCCTDKSSARQFVDRQDQGGYISGGSSSRVDLKFDS